MGKASITCPVCGKLEFEDFEDLENCSECGWKINITQYDNHDYSDGTNPLSVNEYKLQYAAVTNPKTAEAAKKLKDEFYDSRFALYKEYREVTRGKGTQSCSDMTDKLVALRLEYVEKLKELTSSV
ncbi:MAG: CPCC family cysteine-rich protein [Oscillospiraceae bacterium]|nr:CPCC family cysteine-rich protein [Oscillospiraceae bacterium]